MAAEPQLLFDLFDSYWFAHQIFNKTQNPSPQSPKNQELVPETTQNLDEIRVPVKEKFIVRRGRKNIVRSKSKSLSELEFEELKGFMDLGFLFSEKDKDSSLVSIIPGLQRLGKDDDEEQVHGYLNVSRPYLSEAWVDLGKTSEEALRLIRIPAIGSESDMKRQLRFWAHSVASVVR